MRDATTVFEDFNAEPCELTDPSVARQLNLQFYAGHPLRTADGFNIGMLCVIDHQPRPFPEAENALLTALAGIAMRLLELRRALRQQASFCFDDWQPVYGVMSVLFQGLTHPAGPLTAEACTSLCRAAQSISHILHEHTQTVLESELAEAR